ncbi:hypothetical protein [Corynebacterium sp. ES2715-CONJ3]|uniref:hypothetical protein n=1 Tax=Corynebacterium sp. ES2715-CONJ3 TaxID=2974028 RepID=UPI0021676932|nr:hypothetical protein [Corynebacterium sp. ES2715-CONJ3]MCS4492172.1 hypothetical protein [Corynebacterium sp. ES2715-CONJ3]
MSRPQKIPLWMAVSAIVVAVALCVLVVSMRFYNKNSDIPSNSFAHATDMRSYSTSVNGMDIKEVRDRAFQDVHLTPDIKPTKRS